MKVTPLKADRGQSVRVYRNLSNGMLSVQGKQSQGWRVLGHTSSVLLYNVHTTVSMATVARIRREHKKYVCARACGSIVSAGIDTVTLETEAEDWLRRETEAPAPNQIRRVKFNPHTDDTFVYADVPGAYHCSDYLLITASGLMLAVDNYLQ